MPGPLCLNICPTRYEIQTHHGHSWVKQAELGRTRSLPLLSSVQTFYPKSDKTEDVKLTPSCGCNSWFMFLAAREYQYLTCSAISSPPSFQTAFLKYDRHHSGKTSSFNLRLILWDAGVSVSNKVLECLVLR